MSLQLGNGQFNINGKNKLFSFLPPFFSALLLHRFLFWGPCPETAFVEVQDELQTRRRAQFFNFSFNDCSKSQLTPTCEHSGEKKIHFIDVSAIIYVTKKLISHESADFPFEILIKCPDISMPGGGMEMWK